MNCLRAIASLSVVLGSVGCVSTPPADTANLCNLFEERRSWYRAAAAAESRWGIPVAVNMAFIYQESSFRARARPDRSRVLWILPGPRPSSAYGYAQALDSTWQDYERLSGNHNASRSNFSDAVDFVAWYTAAHTGKVELRAMMPAVFISPTMKVMVGISAAVIAIRNGYWMPQTGCSKMPYDSAINCPGVEVTWTKTGCKESSASISKIRMNQSS